jgi:hypothetical protein
MVVNMGLPIGIVKELKFPIPPLMGYLTIVLLLKQGLFYWRITFLKAE